jgi:hypothetical protein
MLGRADDSRNWDFQGWAIKPTLIFGDRRWIAMRFAGRPVGTDQGYCAGRHEGEITPQYQSAPNFAPHRRAMLPRQGVSFFASRCGAAERSDWRELVYDAGSRACASGGISSTMPELQEIIDETQDA